LAGAALKAAREGSSNALRKAELMMTTLHRPQAQDLSTWIRVIDQSVCARAKPDKLGSAQSDRIIRRIMRMIVCDLVQPWGAGWYF
jgi:hypothetical protein